MNTYPNVNMDLYRPRGRPRSTATATATSSDDSNRNLKKRKLRMVPCGSSSSSKKLKASDEPALKHCSSHSHSQIEPKLSELEFLDLFTKVNDLILMEILIRLPPECACRYKAVCRQWCALLSSPFFIARAINLRRQRYTPPLPAPPTFTLVFQYEFPSVIGRDRYRNYMEAISNHPAMSKKQQLLDISYLPRHSLSDAYYSQSTVVKKEIDILRKSDDHNHSIVINGSCNDLLLCSHHGLYRFYVLNLLTKRWIMLPPSGPENWDTISNEVGAEAFAGIVCHNDKNDVNSGDGWYRFKVVVFPACNEYRTTDCLFNPELCQFRLRIYCSESNQWTDFVVDWYPFAWTPNSYRKHNPILAHGGKLHWLNGYSLVSFDPFMDTGEFLKLSHTIKLPDELVHHRPSCFGVCRGLFRVARKFLDEGRTFLHVWELHEDVWQLAHKVLLDNSDVKYGLARVRDPIHFMAFHPFDENVMFVRVYRLVYQFNLRTGQIERYSKLKRPMNDEGWCKAIPPLLHQWYPTAVPSPPPPK